MLSLLDLQCVLDLDLDLPGFLSLVCILSFLGLLVVLGLLSPMCLVSLLGMLVLLSLR